MITLPDFEDAAKALPPNDYRDLLQQTNLQAVTLESLAATLNRTVAESAEAFQVEITRDLEVASTGSEMAEMVLEYTVKASAAGKQALRLKVAYRLVLLVPEGAPLAFYTIYGSRSADMQVWPFLRELTHSLTGRMEISRLTLPLLRNSHRLPTSKRKTRAPAA
jgi:preprotein translocase subunit SecB